MLELSLLLWTGVLYQYSIAYSRINIHWQLYHNKYILKYLDIDNGFYHFVIMGIYRFWILLISYFYDNCFCPLFLSNLIAIILGIIWYYCKFIGNNHIDMAGYFFILNMSEYIYFGYVLQYNTDFFYYLGIYHFITISLASILLIIWIYGVNRCEWNSGNNISHTKISFKEKPLKNDICLFCLENYDNDQYYYLMQCGHYAHSNCLELWWKKYGHKKCIFPFCSN